MDPTQLLNTSTPFDDNKLNLLDTITNTLYTTINNNDRDIANKILNQFQELPESFGYCDFILTHSQNLYTKTFALGIMENVIKTRWNLLDPVIRNSIRNFLVDILIKTVTEPPQNMNVSFFVNKLNIVIIAIAKNEWTTSWPNFISELCSSSRQNQNLCENNMKLLQLLSEEINEFWKNSLTTQKAFELKNKMSTEFSQVFLLCKFIFDNAQNVKQSLLIQAVELFAEYTTWFPINYVFDSKIIGTFLENLKTMPFIRVEVIKCIGQIFSINFEDKINPLTNPEQYMQLKQFIMMIYKNFLFQMLEVTNKTDFADRHQKIEVSKLAGFERLTLAFEQTIINFFKNNFDYIEQFDFQIGTSSGNDFINNYFNEILSGLNFMTQFQLIQNDEIFKSSCEFWEWFTYKLLFLKDKNNMGNQQMMGLSSNMNMNMYVLYTSEMFFYKQGYLPYIDKVRKTISRRMNKPLEVKIDIDENGDLTTDPTTNTIYQSLHETMKNTLIYLTLLDPDKTQEELKNPLDNEVANSANPTKLNRPLLNSVSWSVGCISGAMEEVKEQKFLVHIIKTLLRLCEIIKGKDNKALCASNIMYVVGQYPKFLNSFWKFLKTVVKKLFEFMHEFHPGVQDFACETFLKISMKCAKSFKIVNEDEQEPYINVLVREVNYNTKDLFPHQKLMFYEALGNIIAAEPQTPQQQLYLIQHLMSTTGNEWTLFFEQAAQNAEFLKNQEIAKALELIVRINERVCVSTKSIYWSYGQSLFSNMIKTFIFYSNTINDSFNRGEMININTKPLQRFNRTLLKFFCVLISNTLDQNIIINHILPSLGQLIEVYSLSHQDNRDPNLLLVFTRILDQLKNTDYNYIVLIWKHLCLFTLNMIKLDYHSFPEHRMNFFILLKSLITNAFDSLFKVQEANFNKDVIDTITWAIRHDQPSMYETGLETLLILIQKIYQFKFVNGMNIADLFLRAYYMNILNDVFFVLTDSFHKAGFKLQVEIIQLLIQVIETGFVSENLFTNEATNKMYIMTELSGNLSRAFSNLNKNQIEAFVIAMFNKCSNQHEFKVCIRDFLVNLKSFSGNNEELYLEEKNKQIEEAKKLEEQKRMMIPGMMPMYSVEDQQKFNVQNYTNNDMN